MNSVRNEFDQPGRAGKRQVSNGLNEVRFSRIDATVDRRERNSARIPTARVTPLFWLLLVLCGAAYMGLVHYVGFGDGRRFDGLKDKAVSLFKHYGHVDHRSSGRTKAKLVREDAATQLRFERVKAKAELEDAEVHYRLGLRYAIGQGVGRDYMEAVRWYNKAAEQNHALAQYALGRCYANGQGVARDSAEAMKWYRKAAEQNLPQAQNSLGYCYWAGQGVTRDFVEAVGWYRKAAEQNYAMAQYNLGICYANGQGLPKDQVEAARWYRKAAERNYAAAQNNLGNCYANGRGVAKDEVEAYKWRWLGATQGNEPAKKAITASEGRLSQEQIAEGTRRAQDWLEQREKTSAGRR